MTPARRTSGPAASSGRWLRRGNARRHLETASVHCACCGRMIVDRAWVVGRGTRERVFCEPDCEALYESYWLPRHAIDAGGRADAHR